MSDFVRKSNAETRSIVSRLDTVAGTYISPDSTKANQVATGQREAALKSLPSSSRRFPCQVPLAQELDKHGYPLSSRYASFESDRNLLMLLRSSEVSVLHQIQAVERAHQGPLDRPRCDSRRPGRFHISALRFSRAARAPCGRYEGCTLLSLKPTPPRKQT